MADGTLNTNPYSLFDPSQWSNAYSNYNNQPLPWGNSYAGVPYNSLGQPIQQTPGMTLNQSPMQPQQPASSSNLTAQQQWSYNNNLINAMAQNLQMNPGIQGSGRGAETGIAGPQLGDIVNLRQQNNQMYGGPYNTQMPANAGSMNAQQLAAAMAQQQATPTTSGQVAQTHPGGLTNQQYMALRANPGPVTTPSATVPQNTRGYGPSAGGISAFLANWKPAVSGPSSGYQQTLYNALKAQGY